jgi:putative membrane protein
VEQLIGTVVGRWYVTLFGLTFLWRASRHLGWRRTGIYVAVAVGVGLIAENASVHLGVPYTRYTFNESLKGDEIFVGDVPLMVPLSYTFMAYFAFCAGRLIASGPFRLRAPRAWHELAIAWMLGVWALWVLDPVSRLGDRFYLGELFRYEGPGFWFGLPLGSQLGFAATMGIMLLALQRLDRDAPDAPVPGGLRDHPHLVAVITYHAQVFHLAAVAFYLDADTLGGAAVLIWVPAAVITAVHWSQLGLRHQEKGKVGDAAGEPAGEPLDGAGDLVPGPTSQ